MYLKRFKLFKCKYYRETGFFLNLGFGGVSSRISNKNLHSVDLKVCFYLRVYLISRWHPPLCPPITSGVNNSTHLPSSSSSVFFVFPSWKRQKCYTLIFAPVTPSSHKQSWPSWRHQLNEKSMSSLFQISFFFRQLILFVRMIQSQVVLLSDC